MSHLNHYRAKPSDDGHMDVVCTVDWEAITLDRLTWRYGPERARAIFNGEDPAANHDQALWRSLGERKAVANG